MGLGDFDAVRNLAAAALKHATSDEDVRIAAAVRALPNVIWKGRMRLPIRPHISGVTAQAPSTARALRIIAAPSAQFHENSMSYRFCDTKEK